MSRNRNLLKDILYQTRLHPKKIKKKLSLVTNKIILPTPVLTT